ncbi:MAG: hypothetical protein KDC45_12915 [Bacteroidetes bacterium]|nr:hypothetical protein [Bacteroidota bacterium]
MKKLLLLAGVWLLTGCYETKLDYTLNPDGSGKVDVEITAVSMNMDSKKPANALGAFAQGILEKSKGIETWANIEVKELSADRYFFKGTAYFRDLRTVKFQSYSLCDSLDVKTNKQGNLVIEVSQKESKSAEEPASGSKATMEELIEKQKSEYKQIKPMLSAILGTMRTEMIFHLPGAIGSSSNFGTNAAGNPSVVFDGAKILDAIEKLMADEAFLKKQVQSGGSIKSGPPAGDELNKLIFGEKGPVKLVTKGKLKALFDYEKEAGEVAAAYPAMIEALGLNASVAAKEQVVEPLKSGTFTEVRITKATWSDMVDPDYALFGTEQYYTVTLLGLLPGAIVAAEKANLDVVTADNGEDLLPEDEWSRSTNYLRMSEKKNALMWDFNLKLPGDAVRGIRHLEGSVVAMSASTTREIKTKKILFSGLQTGLSDVEIESFSVENNELTLKFKIQKDLIKSISVKDAKGSEIETFWASSWGDDESATITLSANSGEFPEQGTVTCVVYDGIEKLSIPFVIKNVNLFGKPNKK